MLQIKKIIISNLFQFQQATIEFTNGLNLILGPNGSGKTNLINSIYFGLTGDVPLTIKSCKRIGSTGPYFVDLYISFNNEPIRIFREPGGLHRLEHGSEAFIGAKSVNQYIENELGLTRKFIERCLILKQGALRRFMESSKGERLEAFTGMLNLGKFKNLYMSIRDLINRKKGEVDKDISTYINKLQMSKLELEELNKHNIPDESTIVTQISILERLNENHTKFSNRISELRQVENKIKELESEYNQIIKITSHSKIPELTLNEIEELTYLARTRESLLRAIASLRRKLKEFQNKQVQLASEDELRSYYSNLGVIESLLERTNTYLSLITKENICPVCTQSVNSTELILKYSSKKRDLEEQLRNLKENIIAYKKKLELKNEYEKLFRQYSQKLEQWRELKTRFKKWVAIGVSKKLMKNAVEIEKLVSRLSKINQLKELLIAEKARRESIIDKIKELQQEREILESKLPLKNVEIDEARLLLKQAQRKTELMGIVGALKDFEIERKKLKILKERIEIAEKVRDLVHENGIPRALIQRTLSHIKGGINGFLNCFGCKFNVEIDDDVNFKIKYQNGLTFDDNMLSYGEQLMLAFSITATLACQFVGNCLIMDEPTLGLDSEKIDSLPEIFELLELRFPSLQILCATHEMKLQACAKNIINITKFT
jgi:exonuclease SbcC